MEAHSLLLPACQGERVVQVAHQSLRAVVEEAEAGLRTKASEEVVVVLR